MRTFTLNQLRFAGIITLLTLAFRFGLSNMLTQSEFVLVWIVAAFYAVLMGVTGYFTGKKDHESLPFANIGFKFHLITYVVFIALSEIWFLLGYNSLYESIKTVHLTAIFWGMGVLIHFILFLLTSRDTIKGIDKSEIFE